MSTVVPMSDAARCDEPALDVLERLIGETYAQHEQASRHTAETARRLGVYFLEAKRMCGHGHFMRWCKAKLPHISQSKIEYCMRIASKYKTEAEIATIANLTTSDVLRRIAEHGEERDAPPPLDHHTCALFSETEAPTPTDAASRLRAAGMEVIGGGQPHQAQRLKFLLERIAREKPWDEFNVEDLCDLDREIQVAIEKAAPRWIEWLGELLQVARNAQAIRPRFEADRDRRRLSA